MKISGAERISADANTALTRLMEEYAASVSKEAVKLAGHAGRKTVKAVDVKMAAETVR